MTMRIAATSVLLVVMALPACSQDQNAYLVEAANRVATYWRGVFATCPDPQHPRGTLYAEVLQGRMKGSILQIADPIFQFQTNQIETIPMLNGMEFSAASSVRASAARYFDPNNGWTAWKQAAELTVYVRRENGKWSVQAPDGVSFASPPASGGPETVFRALKCDKVPKQ